MKIRDSNIKKIVLVGFLAVIFFNVKWHQRKIFSTKAVSAPCAMGNIRDFENESKSLFLSFKKEIISTLEILNELLIDHQKNYGDFINFAFFLDEIKKEKEAIFLKDSLTEEDVKKTYKKVMGFLEKMIFVIIEVQKKQYIKNFDETSWIFVQILKFNVYEKTLRYLLFIEKSSYLFVEMLKEYFKGLVQKILSCDGFEYAEFDNIFFINLVNGLIKFIMYCKDRLKDYNTMGNFFDYELAEEIKKFVEKRKRKLEEYEKKCVNYFLRKNEQLNKQFLDDASMACENIKNVICDFLVPNFSSYKNSRDYSSRDYYGIYEDLQDFFNFYSDDEFEEKEQSLQGAKTATVVYKKSYPNYGEGGATRQLKENFKKEKSMQRDKVAAAYKKYGKSRAIRKLKKKVKKIRNKRINKMRRKRKRRNKRKWNKRKWNKNFRRFIKKS